MAHLLDELGEGGHRDDLWQLGGGGPPSPQEIRRQQYDQLRQAYMRRLPDHVVTGGMMGIRLREWWETRFAPQMQQRSAAKNAAETRNRAMGFETKRRFAEAEALYRGAAVAGDAAAGAHAARLMEQCGSEGEAEDWYGSAARAGHLPAADAGYVGAMVELAGMLRRRGDVEAVESWLRKAADMGSPDAMETLADMLKGRGDGQEAQSWRARAEEARIVSVTFETSNPPMPNSDG